MATRPLEITKNVIKKRYTVKAATTVVAYRAVKLSADDEVEPIAATTDEAIGIALEGGAAGTSVEVALLGSGIVPVEVGTGDATRGQPAIYVSDGLTDGTPGGGSTQLFVVGQFMQSGVDGDRVGLNLGMACWAVES